MEYKKSVINMPPSKSVSFFAKSMYKMHLSYMNVRCDTWTKIEMK